MLTFLFWNVGRRPIEETVARIARHHDVDVLMLAECPPEIGPMLVALNNTKTEYQFAPTRSPEPDPDLCIYTRFDRTFMEPVADDLRVTFRQLSMPGAMPLLLAVVHSPSKLYMEDSSRHEYLLELGQLILEVEQRIGHSRTLLVGDLNANPYEAGVVGAAGLHAVMTRERAARLSRKVQGRERPFFYNPMWALFGDSSSGPPGTYHYDSGQYVNYYWHIVDQVMMRPSLIEQFDISSLEVITTDGEVSLLTTPRGRPSREWQKGIPDAKRFSDHLPILFRLSV